MVQHHTSIFLNDDDGLSREETLAYLFGFTATAAFTTQYLPQAYKNYQRGSVAGFSTTGIILKLWGAAFLCVNAFYLQGVRMH